MTRSRSFTLKVIGVLGVVLLYGGLLTSAFAEHGTRTIDASPEQTRAPVGTQVHITVSLSQPAASDIERPINIDAEIESGPNNQDGTAADPETTPDFTCDIPAGAQRCYISYVGGPTAGTDVLRIWLDHDHDDETTEADEGEERTGDSDQLASGDGDDCNEPGPSDTTPPSGEPDCTDVVEVIWSAATTEATTLDCDDSTGPDRERETNASGESEAYSCKLRTETGARGPEGTVYGEIENGINDPDHTDGASYDSPDFTCVASTSGSTEGDCTITVTQAEGEAGTAEICFWSYGTESDETVATAAGLCGDEATGENQQTNEADVGNDMADQVELTWSAASTTATNTATTSSTTTSKTTGTTSTTTTARTTGSMSTPPGQSTTTSTTTQADERVASTLTIRYRRGAFKGTVGSSEDRCKGSRLITVKKVRRGPDRSMGTTRSKASGAWSLRKRARRGRYYAVASTKVFTESDGHRVICQRAKSRTIRR